MTGQNSRAQRDLLRDHWSRWTAIVALFARRRPARRRVDPVAYATLRDDLIAACRSLAETDAERRSYYTALEDTVRPWLSPHVLDRTDREILFTLLSRCHEVERELTGRRWVLEWPSHLGPAPMIAAGAVVVGLAWALQEFGLPVLAALRDAADTAWLTFKFASPLQKLSAIAVLIVAASIYTVSRSVRS
jgi:hypothetical protein